MVHLEARSSSQVQLGATSTLIPTSSGRPESAGPRHGAVAPSAGSRRQQQPLCVFRNFYTRFRDQLCVHSHPDRPSPVDHPCPRQRDRRSKFTRQQDGGNLTLGETSLLSGISDYVFLAVILSEEDAEITNISYIGMFCFCFLMFPGEILTSHPGL